MAVHHNKDLPCSGSCCRQWRGTRSESHFRMPPLVVPPWPVLTVCDHGQEVALPDRLSYTASSFFTRRPHSWSWTARIHRVLYRTTRRELEHRARQYTCGSLPLSPQPRPVRTRLVIRTRIQSLIRRSSSEASSTSPTFHSLLLRTASWSHRYWISMCFALPEAVLLIKDSAALESMWSRIGTTLPKSLANA